MTCALPPAQVLMIFPASCTLRQARKSDFCISCVISCKCQTLTTKLINGIAKSADQHEKAIQQPQDQRITGGPVAQPADRRIRQPADHKSTTVCPFVLFLTTLSDLENLSQLPHTRSPGPASPLQNFSQR